MDLSESIGMGESLEMWVWKKYFEVQWGVISLFRSQGAGKSVLCKFVFWSGGTGVKIIFEWREGVIDCRSRADETFLKHRKFQGDPPPPDHMIRINVLHVNIFNIFQQ